MSQRHPREEKRGYSGKHLPVASKCLAIVLLPKKRHSRTPHDVNNKEEGERKCGGVSSGNNNPTTSKSVCAAVPVYNGKEILEDFKYQNKTCYWNPALIESIRKLDYLGFVEPCTVLVSGEDIHLENLRSAWGRRVLKAPNNFTIDRIGDVNGIEMQVIPQTQFIPLPDSLCLIITELNNGNHTATLEAIRTRLQHWYSNTTLPSNQLIYDTLSQLIRERKVFHNGTGYCVVTPETYHLPTSDPSLTCTASWLPYHPMYIPVFPQQQQLPYRAPTRSISCQVTQIEEKVSSEGSHRAEKKRTRPRSHSVRACRGKDKAAQAEKENADFRRASSARYKTEKAKAMTKDLNLKSSNLNQEKDKGEKVSLFSKIFGRKKKSSSAGTATVSTSSGGATQSTEAEYVTFSGQFPPPEWMWYRQQLERQRRTEEWVSQQLPKSATWGHFNAAGAVPSSGIAELGSVETARTESSHPYTQHPTVGTQHPVMRSQGHVYATLGRLRGAAVMDGMRGGREEERKMKQQHRMSGSHARKGHGHHHHRDRDHHHHKYRDHRKTLQENNYDVPVAHSQQHGAVGHTAGMDVSPYSLEEDNIYSTPGPSQPGQFMPWHSTPCYDVPPAKFDSMAMPSNIVCNSTTQQEPSDAGKVQSSHNSHGRHRAHRSKKHSHRAYNLFEANPGNDISVEYKGRMPKKNSTVAQSRDSGVNCIGLPKNRQHYMEEQDLHMTQEASAYLPSRHNHPTLADTATSSSLHPDTVSTQRGTPYTSMEQRNPEGCSTFHQPIINTVVSHGDPSSADMTSGVSPDNEHQTQIDDSQTGVGAEGERSGASEQEGGHPQLEERSECEGVSHTSTPHYMATSPDNTSMDRSPDPDITPQYVAMSYCDSSMGEEGAGGGEVLLCQAEINQFQVPQLVLDTESRLDRCNISSEPDIALSSAGSKDTLDRTNEDSERSVETVIRSPQFAALHLQPCGKTKDSEDLAQCRKTGVSDGTVNAQGRSVCQTDGCVVNALGSEFQEMGVVDSGFSSPRNNENKENQQQQTQSATDNKSAQPACHPHQKAPGSEGVEEIPPQEHKSKHERIKAFVRQSNQLLEQRQFTGHGNVPYAGGIGSYTSEHDGYVNYPPQNPHSHHYAPFSKPLHPVGQQQGTSAQPQVVLNNQRHHHHPPRPHSLHGGLKERPKSQNMWSGQNPTQGQVGGKMLPNDLKAFQEQQLKGKKIGLNGEEYEVVGVV